MTLSKLQLTSPAEAYDRRRRWLGSRAYWICQGIGWGGLLVLMIGPLPFRTRMSSVEVAAVLVFVVIGLGLTHFLRMALIALLRTPSSWPRLVGPIVLLTGCGALLYSVMQVGIVRTILPHDAVFLTSRPAYDPLLYTLLDTFSMSSGTFVVWTGAYFGLRIYRRYQEARSESLQLNAHLQEAAWQALRAQLNPHLLFNSLNSIRALIPRDQPAPREAIIHLSQLLRTTLSLKEEQLVPLRRELETVDSFLALERLRFEQRLQVNRQVESEALAWLVPPFVVQILVENAVKFGVAAHETGGFIELHVEIVDENLVATVINGGQLGITKDVHSTGLGLHNLRSRLALQFGAAAQLTVENHGPDRVRARVVVPRERHRMESDSAFPNESHNRR